jgi:cysteine protease ATG4
MELVDYYVGYDVGEIDDIPKSDSDVWILGKKYNAIEGGSMIFRLFFVSEKSQQFFLNASDLELIRRDIQSKLWCTYRRGFEPLGTNQLTSDKGEFILDLLKKNLPVWFDFSGSE